MFRVISGRKIKQKRGNLSLQDVVNLSDNQFTRAALSHWENGIWKPKDKNIPALLKALNCDYDDITEPVQVELCKQ